ncbi:RNA polymerase sigma factor [Mucisphaera sp.]|uniref:RNA polymerase sigma factor n=1 Tax=Mucisphaera sp. TaxID=2913024 RepID=UPI003D0CDBA6
MRIDAQPLQAAANLNGRPVDGLLHRAAEGDAQAWRALVETYTRRVYGLLLRQCANPELAEELTQEAFAKMVKALQTDNRYQEQGRFEPWLFRIAMNGLRDEMRRRKRQAVGRGGPQDTAENTTDTMSSLADRSVADPLEQMTHEEQVAGLRQALTQLSEPDREVLHLRHTAGLSFAQIAETLEQPLGTVLARAHRAIGKLRKMMTDPNDEVDAA